MSGEYRIISVENPKQSAWDIIGRGVSEFNRQQTEDGGFQRLCFVIQSPDNEIVAGVLGEVYYEWFHLDLLWVKEELRGRGYGRRLLALAEREARERGAKDAYLDTFSFQAPDFYKRRGYEVFGELLDYPPGHQRYFMKKRL
jgi:GNAT superfamily N-acetyltransferase